jgi:hypothetical protein
MERKGTRETREKQEKEKGGEGPKSPSQLMKRPRCSQGSQAHSPNQPPQQALPFQTLPISHTIRVVGSGQQHQEGGQRLWQVPEVGQPLLILLFILRADKALGKRGPPRPS